MHNSTSAECTYNEQTANGARRNVSGMIRHMFIDTCTEKTIITGSCEAIRLCTKKTQHEQCDAEINIYSNETPEMLNVQHNTICRNTINMALVNISTG